MIASNDFIEKQQNKKDLRNEFSKHKHFLHKEFLAIPNFLANLKTSKKIIDLHWFIYCMNHIHFPKASNGYLKAYNLMTYLKQSSRTEVVYRRVWCSQRMHDKLPSSNLQKVCRFVLTRFLAMKYLLKHYAFAEYNWVILSTPRYSSWSFWTTNFLGKTLHLGTCHDSLICDSKLSAHFRYLFWRPVITFMQCISCKKKLLDTIVREWLVTLVHKSTSLLYFSEFYILAIEFAKVHKETIAFAHSSLQLLSVLNV